MSTLTKELGDNPGRSKVAHLGHCFCDGCGMEIGGSYLGGSDGETTRPQILLVGPKHTVITWVEITPISRVKFSNSWPSFSGYFIGAPISPFRTVRGPPCTVDGSEIRRENQLRWVGVFHYLGRVLYIPGGCLGFLNYQQ